MAYRPVILSRQKFLASGALTFPENTKFASFKGIGGGGSGGSGGGANAAGGTVGGGGGGGGAANMGDCTVDVNPALGYTVTIAPGGASVSGANAAPGNFGNPGGDTMVTETISGNIVAAFRGGSGGYLGNTPANPPTGLPGADQAPFGGLTPNAYEDTVQSLTTDPTSAALSNRQSLPRSGGLGGPSNVAGNHGASDYRTDTSVLTTATFFTGGNGAPGGGPGNGGGGGGGGGSALGPGADGGPGAGGNGLPGNSALPNTGAGGGGGGGAGTGGVSGGNSGSGGSGYVEVIAYGFG